jgi:hypothetical protein
MDRAKKWQETLHTYPILTQIYLKIFSNVDSRLQVAVPIVGEAFFSCTVVLKGITFPCRMSRLPQLNVR